MRRHRLWTVAVAAGLSGFISVGAVRAQVAQASPYYRVVAAGRTLRVDAFTVMNPDCSLRGPTTVELVSGPRGGQVTVCKAYDFPNYAASNVRAACDRRRIAQTTLDYRARPDFAGQDQFTVELQFPDGIARTIRYFVNVRPPIGGEEGSRGGQTASCAAESRLASINSVVPARIAFINRSAAPRTVYWLNFQGQRVRYGTLEPGSRLSFNTYLTHPWVVADGDDACKVVALPRRAGDTVTVR